MSRQLNHPAGRRRCQRGLRLLLGLLVLLTVAAAIDATTRWPVYRVALSADLGYVDVEVRLPPGEARTLHARRGSLAAATLLEGCDRQPVARRGDRIVVGSAATCIRYRYPLNALWGRRGPQVAEGVVVSTPDEWLWMPEWSSGLPLRIELVLPPAMAASVPWTPIAPGVFELPRSPDSATATAVFGAFRELTVPVGQAVLRVAAVNGPSLTLDPAIVRRWLATAAADVAGVSGSFPSPRVQVIVQPVRSGNGSPVPFGYVIRDGGDAVRFFVDPQRPLAELVADWSATHEFSHLLLPYVRNSEKWVSEGFASYYQNVLLARRGAYSEQEAWSHLHRSFVRAGQISDPPPLRALHERRFWEVRMLVYWSGAALALAADTRLRHAARHLSLDVVLGRLADCCLPSERVWTAVELFSRLDALAGEQVFMPLYEQLDARPGMPDLTELYAELGIEPMSGDRVRLSGDARLAAVREAIMARKD